jgi:hypothetical protein
VLPSCLLSFCRRPAADPDPVKTRLDTAQDAYRAEMKVYREKGTAWLETREGTARKSGDKKAVDRVHEEQRGCSGR